MEVGLIINLCSFNFKHHLKLCRLSIMQYSLHHCPLHSSEVLRTL